MEHEHGSDIQCVWVVVAKTEKSFPAVELPGSLPIRPGRNVF